MQANVKEQLNAFFEGKTSEELSQMLRDFNTLMTYYRCAILEVETKFNVLNEQLSLVSERNPIVGINSRLKSLDSIREKLFRKGFPVTLSAVEEQLKDVAGIRVICGFVDDIYMLADCLISQDDVTLIERKDYIKNPKPNGYRSLHLIVEVPIFLCNEKKRIKVEVQLRTIAMESWANLEHRLRYKKNLDEELLAKTADMLLECAELSETLDEKMQRIRNMIEKEA